MNKLKNVNCFECRFLAISWDKNLPYICKKIGFKSKLIPSKEVFKNSKIPCQFFEKKNEV
jgi:hypothetical protein